MAAKFFTLPGDKCQPMPAIGLGTWQMTKEHDIVTAINAALDAGYRHFDTARIFDNEYIIGKELKKRFDQGHIRRQDVFISGKLTAIYMGDRMRVRKGVRRSLEALQLDYIDLLLIQSPIGFKYNDDEKLLPVDRQGYLEVAHHDLVRTWKALEELVDEGWIKAIGLSNFNAQQINRIWKQARIPIANVQMECHVYLQNNKMVQHCKDMGITVTAFAPLGSPNRAPYVGHLDYPILMEDPKIINMGVRYNKSPAQILLRFLIQRDIAVIPKSVTPERIKENIEVFNFEIDSDDMKDLEALNQNCRYFDFDNRMSYSNYNKLVEDPLVINLATRYNKTPDQILRQNLVQKSNPAKVQADLGVFGFQLAADDVEELDAVAQRYSSDVDKVYSERVRSHPEYPFTEGSAKSM